MAILVKVYFFKCQKLCSYACLFQLEIIIQPQIMNRHKVNHDVGEIKKKKWKEK